MRFIPVTAVAAVAVLAGCASTASIPSGMKAGQFVAFACENGKRFQARAADDGKTVRIRYEGGYELDSKGGGVFEADGWKLITQGAGAATLIHNDKPVGTHCKAA